MSLDQILSELFFDAQEPLRLLRKNGIYDILNNSIEVIKIEIEKPSVNFLRFGTIASTILVGVNNRLRNVTDLTEKGYLELILKDIAEYLLNEVIRKSKNAEGVRSEISSSLKTASSINGYNYEAIIKLLKLEGSKQIGLQAVNRLEDYFYYQWNGYPHDLTELVGNLKSDGWIVSVKDFKKIFSCPEEQTLQVQFSKDKVQELLIMFDELKDRKLVTPKGGKGHFHPLKVHLVDFEKKVLFSSEPKTIKMIAKRNLNVWETNKEKAVSWISGFKVKLP